MTVYQENILFVDEDEVFCEGLLRLFNSQSSFEVCGVANEYTETLKKAEALSPEIIILNINRAHSDWIETIRLIRQKMPFITIVIISNNRNGLEEVMRSGVNAFLSKDLPFKDILHILGSINENSAMIYPPDVTTVADESEETSAKPSRLSKREKEILSLVSKGFQNKEIAHALSIKIQTVNNHLYNINRKLGCSNRTEAVFEFFDKGKFDSIL